MGEPFLDIFCLLGRLFCLRDILRISYILLAFTAVLSSFFDMLSWVLRFEGVEVAVTQDLKGSLTLITPLRFHGRACSGSTMSITMVERRKMGNPLTHRFGCQAFVTLSRVTHAIWELSVAD
jgi:hypothetical protein